MKKLLLLSIILIVGCDKTPTASTDCAGVVNGIASKDDCGMCAGGTTGVSANYLKDCAGVCNGDTTEEECDACELLSGVWDCAGLCNGSAVEDCAGVCGGSAVLSGCDNKCNSTKVADCSGVCGGNNTTCSAVGTYTLTTLTGYNTSNCSGQSENMLIEMDLSMTLTLHSNATATITTTSEYGTEIDTGSWSQNGNKVTIIWGYDTLIGTLSGNTLSGQDVEDDYCVYFVFTEI